MVRIWLFFGLITLGLTYSRTWEGYVNEDLIGSGYQDATILSGDGSELRAISAGFSVSSMFV